MDKQALINRLQELPAEIEDGENGVIEAQFKLQVAKDALANREAELILSGEINGKNAEQRNAQMRQATDKERRDVAHWEAALNENKVCYYKACNEFKALRAIANILSGEVA